MVVSPARSTTTSLSRAPVRNGHRRRCRGGRERRDQRRDALGVGVGVADRRALLARVDDGAIEERDANRAGCRPAIGERVGRAGQARRERVERVGLVGQAMQPAPAGVRIATSSGAPGHGPARARVELSAVIVSASGAPGWLSGIRTIVTSASARTISATTSRQSRRSAAEARAREVDADGRRALRGRTRPSPPTRRRRAAGGRAGRAESTSSARATQPSTSSRALIHDEPCLVAERLADADRERPGADRQRRVDRARERGGRRHGASVRRAARLRTAIDRRGVGAAIADPPRIAVAPRRDRLGAARPRERRDRVDVEAGRERVVFGDRRATADEREQQAREQRARERDQTAHRRRHGAAVMGCSGDGGGRRAVRPRASTRAGCRRRTGR